MTRIIFLNVGWMKSYQGLRGGDTIQGGGLFVQETGYGHEIFNFLPYEGYYYGFVETKHRDGIRNTINIKRLGASKTDDYIDGVLAVWVAKDPQGGTYIIGWFDDARVYKKEQAPLNDPRREYQGKHFGYFIKAKKEKCRLLSPDKRTFQIPRKRKGGMGQSNIWYADRLENKEFVQKILGYISTGRIDHLDQINVTPRQLDPLKRVKIEESAIKLVTKYYEDLGYQVSSVEGDNIGWDLEAFLESKTLRLEVKGLSQNNIAVELTPNEYQKMDEYKETYRVCVVTNALEDSTSLFIFSYSPDSNSWEDYQGRKLIIQEIQRVSARLYV